ncbi:MAG: hypothetical protein ACI9N9_001340 [Enterobacterales bacterium]|jgi:hypothetical protein
MNISNIKKFIGMGLGILSLSLMTLNTFAEATVSREETTTQPYYVECLNDSIVIDYSLMIIESEKETDNGWNYARRYNFSGSAVDLSGNNSWSVHGGWSTTEHVAYLDTGAVTKIHHQSRDIMIADNGNTAGNLLITWTLRGVYDYGAGEWLERERTFSASCK